MIQFLNYKKTFILFAFIALMLASPFAFGRQESGGGEQTSPTFLRFTCERGMNMNFRSPGDLDNLDLEHIGGVLSKGSIIQLPPGVTKYNGDESINFNDTIDNWRELSRNQQEHQPFYHQRPRYRNCNTGRQGFTAGQSTCSAQATSEVYLPIKVVRSSDPRIDTDTDEAYGYLALDWIKRNANPNCYQTITMSLEDALKVTDTANADGVASGDRTYYGTGEEATSPDQAAEREELSTTAAQGYNHPINNCNNTRYRSSNYVTNSCLHTRGMNLKQKAELVMKDVIEISRRRGGFNLDPRVSACMAYRESNFSPNAVGGTPDWGMYQIIKGTAQGVLGQRSPVTPGFAVYRNNWELYRQKMLQSTLAQADLHHSVLFSKANGNYRRYRGNGRITQPLTARLNSSAERESSALYQELATRYNGGGAAARRYGRKIRSCYDAMKRISHRNGTIHSPNGLEAALELAKD